jgi:two-component system LytT family response regulator
MKKIRTLIVDDEPLARRGLQIRLDNYDDIVVIGESRNGREAIETIREQSPDLVLLDIQMPGMSGFDVLHRISGADMPIVVFVTAFDEYAVKAFEANALDYLLKPIDDERLAESIQRVRVGMADRDAFRHQEKLLSLVCDLTGRHLSLDAALAEANGAEAPYVRTLAIQNGRETDCIDVTAIDWIDAAGDYMCVHVDGETHILRGTMKRLEQVLDPDIFIRVHRSAIVNRHRVRSLRSHRNGEYFLKLVCDHELKLSRKYKSSVDRIANKV